MRKKLSKKEVIKQKQAIKKQKQQEKIDLVNKYIDDIELVIDNGYLNMIEIVDQFNSDMMSCVIEYGNFENEIRKLFKLDDDSIDNIHELQQRIIDFENRNEDIYKTITTRDLKENKILSQLPIVADEVAKIINKADSDLSDYSNKAYVISMLTNKSYGIFTSYNKHIVETTLESNSYIDLYIQTREDFLDFISDCKEEIQNEFYSKELEKIEDLEYDNKYRQRLRVEYSDFNSFMAYKGYELIRQNSTTHAVWKNPETGHSVPIPNKSGTMRQGTSSKILKQIGSNRNELAEFIYG